jgi:hypothetical protein
MNLETALVLLGLIPASAYLVYAFYQLVGRLFIGAIRGSDGTYAYYETLGGSSIKLQHHSLVEMTPQTGGPVFKNLQVEATALLPAAKWRFRVRFALTNFLEDEIALNDIHVKVYEKAMPLLPKASWFYFGEVLLMQDNTIWKEEGKSYSLKNGDTFDITLIMEMTRREVDYGARDVIPGPIRALFGIFIDYYILFPSGEINAQTVLSDVIYMFENKWLAHRGAKDWRYINPLEDGDFIIKAVNGEEIEQLKSLHTHNPAMLAIVAGIEAQLKRHLQSKPIPK